MSEFDPEQELLPEQSRDDTDVGWGDDEHAAGAAERDAAWYERERPPHHEDR
jgi:hypothetical protein